MSSKNYIFLLITVLLLVYYSLFLIHKINLTAVDLGRHLKNGEMVLQGNLEVLNKNFYSYTNYDFKVINHHWGSGLIFYLLSRIGGIKAIHLFFIGLSLATFLIFFYVAVKESNFLTASLISFLIIPLIGERIEVRPEAFSYFFGGLFLIILWRYCRYPFTYRSLFILPILAVVWVNLHIYFVIGLFLIGVFLFDSLIRKNFEHFKRLGLAFFLTLIATLINPAGLKGVLVPLNIFKNYGYRVLENQSVPFLDRLGLVNNPNLLFVKIILVIMAASFVWVLIKNRHDFSVPYFLLAVVFATMAFLAIRNFTIFGLFSLPIINANLRDIFSKKNRLVFGGTLIFLFLVAFFSTFQYPRLWSNFGLGLFASNNGAAEFFKQENIKGPIFNNYDIGSYLIYHLFPKEKVFVDNRPEAYPSSFFKEVYVPTQENEDIWRKKEKEYGFNVIFFNYHDATPWTQKFLIQRVNDSSWVPVFVDQYAIIFLKRNTLNKNIIEKYKIPKEFFRIIKTK